MALSRPRPNDPAQPDDEDHAACDANGAVGAVYEAAHLARSPRGKSRGLRLSTPSAGAFIDRPNSLCETIPEGDL